MGLITSYTKAALDAFLSAKLDTSGGTLTGDLILSGKKLVAGSVGDVLGSALEVVRNGVTIGRIDNNANGLRVQAQAGKLQLRGSGNNGIEIDSAGIATFAVPPYIGTDPLAEVIDDRVSSLLVAGSGVTKTYDDVAGTLTLASSGGGGVAGDVNRSKMPAGNWVRPPDTHKDGTIPAGTMVGTIWFIPYFGTVGSETQQIDKIRCNFETAGSGDSTVLLGLYDSDPTTWRPTGTPLTSQSIGTTTTGQKEAVFTAVTKPAGRPIFVAMLALGTTCAAPAKIVFGGDTYPNGWFGTDSNAAGEPAYSGNAVMPHGWYVTGKTALDNITGATFNVYPSLPFTAVRYV